MHVQRFEGLCATDQSTKVLYARNKNLHEFKIFTLVIDIFGSTIKQKCYERSLKNDYKSFSSL